MRGGHAWGSKRCSVHALDRRDVIGEDAIAACTVLTIALLPKPPQGA